MQELSVLVSLTCLHLHIGPVASASPEGAYTRQCCIAIAGVGDAGLQELSALTSLTSLSLDSRLFTDLGMRHLKGLTNLVVLDLFAAKVSDIGCGYLRWGGHINACSMHSACSALCLGILVVFCRRVVGLDLNRHVHWCMMAAECMLCHEMP